MNTETDTIQLTAAEVEALIADAPGEDKEAFVPTDAAGVDWVLAKMAAARAAAKLIREQGEAMAREEERKAEALAWKFGPAIQTWANNELLGEDGHYKKGNAKSKKLWHGIVGYKQKPAGVDITDPAAVLAHVKENLTEAYREGVDKAALTKYLLETGEVLDGVTFRPAEDEFYIK